ncbi:MAG: AAA family ATPase [Tindallia sp. MSAO_Bac2]|nr:MAG: AAA family ATPase [Tindallia sp. MSAO_Bac2]
MDILKDHGGDFNETNTFKYECQALRNVFDSVLECIVVVDASGYIQMINKSYAEFLEINTHEAIGKHVTKVIENTRLHEVLKTGKAEVEQIQRIGNNDAVTMRVPIKENGTIVGAIGRVIYRDVKEVRELYHKLETAKRELSYYRRRLKIVQGSHDVLDTIVGDSPRMKELKSMVAKLAQSDSTVLITGESGTGKEVFANAIHEMSERRYENFVKINCAAIPENILESELFGYTDGSFTGARKGGKPGKFELANSGTIFLDEIGDMGFDMQAKILRVIQEKSVERIGAEKPCKIDVRIIAATNQNLQEKIRKGEFREDLYYRLSVVPLEIPPLRGRVEDIPLLCDFFLKKYNEKLGIGIDKIDNEAMGCIVSYKWPGNIRELENTIERIYNFIDSNKISKRHLPDRIINNTEKLNLGSLNIMMDQYEKMILLRALENYRDNKSKAAKVLGINRTTLYQKMKKHGISG